MQILYLLFINTFNIFHKQSTVIFGHNELSIENPDYNFSFFTNKTNSFNRGIDMRYKKNNIQNENELFNIKKFFYYKKILEQLNNTKISIYDKVTIIENENIIDQKMGINLFKGGLLDDFNFEI